MRIALIAHDSRKELLAQFCTAYVRILSQNELVATGVRAKWYMMPVGCRFAACTPVHAAVPSRFPP